MNKYEIYGLLTTIIIYSLILLFILRIEIKRKWKKKNENNKKNNL